MIRRQVILRVEEKTNLSYNYQHEILKNLYKLIKVADEKRANMLHNKGYRVESGHIFKLFNFTVLFDKAVFSDSSIVCSKETTVKLLLSGKKEVIELILKGLILEQGLVIDGNNFKFESVALDKKVIFREVMLYKTLSPVITTTKEEDTKIYLNPYQQKYYKNLVENAKRKYKLMYGKDYEGEIFFEIDDLLEMKEKFIKIKQGGVKGYSYNIWVQAERDMQKIVYYMGLGQNSSVGCGCLSFITGVSNNE